MFTGIVETTGSVSAISAGSDSAHMTFLARGVLEDAKVGASIAVNGVCLTVTEFDEESFSADLMNETLMRSAMGELNIGDSVNIERAMPLTGRMGGHIVQGHVDGVGAVTARKDTDGWMALTIEASAALAPYIAEKGSITVDGVSLTVNGVRGNTFDLMIIPHTAAVTTLSRLQAGMRVNLEVDIMARYAARLAATTGTQDGH